MDELFAIFSDSGGIFLAVFVIIFILWLLQSVFRVVQDYERLVIFQFGVYGGIRGPGLTIVIPLIERAVKVDLREDFFDIPSQTAITRDNAPIAIDFLVYYRITEPDLSVLKVDNVVSASINIATTTLRAVIGDIDLDDVLSKRDQINDTLRVKLDETTSRWGMKITSVEIREIEPPRDIQDAMNRQMSAERDRRALVTEADGRREASISVAEGEKQAAILKAQGERESSILKAEGERQAQLLRAQGFAAALAAIYDKAQDVDQKTMALQYLEALKWIGSSSSTKFVLPVEMVSFVEQFTQTMSSGMSSNGKTKE